jgi:hypothetical protein
MSCWVVPAVAAEMWGIPVSAILCRARSGEVPTKSENGFLFIDVAPDSPTCEPPKFLRPAHPPTYVTVDADEAEQPAELAVAGSISPGGAATLSSSAGDGLDENLMPPIPVGDWRLGRQYSSRARRAPAGNS